MFSYFTELNRKRPPAEALDFVVHTSCPIVHACDDTTVMENLEALPHVVRSTRSFSAGKPYRVGPSAIGARDNPYGAAATPESRRAAASRSPFMDPRQRGLLGAAWYLGYFAHMARGAVDAVCLAAPVGEFGVAYARTDYPQPWFDEQRRRQGLSGLSRAARPRGGGRQPAARDQLSDGAAVQAVAWQADGGRRGLARQPDRRAADRDARGPGGRARPDRAARPGALRRARRRPGRAGGVAAEGEVGRLELDPYAVLRVAIAR